MFTPRPCSVPGCRNSALTGLEACFEHCDDLLSYTERILEILRGQGALVDYDISGIALREVDLRGVQISGCSLKGVRLHGVILRESVFQLVFGDRAEMIGSDFSGSTFKNSVFAGSLIEECLFENCDLLQCNFMGVIVRRSRFTHSNLYASRFIEGEFDSVGMKDCNLTRARFTADVKGIDFRSSNLNEARFVEEGR